MHEIKHGEKIIRFELEIKKVKHINLRVNPDMNVIVSANKDVQIEQIYNFVLSRADWIEKNVKLYKSTQSENDYQKEYVNGEDFKYLGKQYRLKIEHTDKIECVKLVKETKVDFLAPALGSVHGPYKGEPVLGFKEMEEIKNATNIPLVLHGGTGIPDEKIKKAISCGTAKINVNTECQLAFARELRALLQKDDKVYDPRKIIGPAAKGIAAAVKEKINVFGSTDKATK